MKFRTIIHFVRHGHVENPEDIWYGRRPGFYLSTEGVKAIENQLNFFIPRSIAAIYSSPLERARQSAEILRRATFNADIINDDRLLEVALPPHLDGQSRTQAFTYPTARDGGAELREDVVRRMRSFIESVALSYGGKEVIAVSHRIPISTVVHEEVYGTGADHNPVFRHDDQHPDLGGVNSLVYWGLELKERWIEATTPFEDLSFAVGEHQEPLA